MLLPASDHPIVADSLHLTADQNGRHSATRLSQSATKPDVHSLKSVKGHVGQSAANLPELQIVKVPTNDVAQVKKLIDQINMASVSLKGPSVEGSEGAAVYWAPKEESAELQLRKTIAILNSEQLLALDKAYQKQYGVSLRDALLKDEYIGAGTRDCLAVYLKDSQLKNDGIDKRSAGEQGQLLEVALKWHDLEMLGEALGGNSPAAKSARASFLQLHGEQRLRDTFSGEALTKAFDVAHDGHVNLATIADGDLAHWYHKNKDHLSDAFMNASSEERRSFAVGREISLSNSFPTNADEQAALDSYQKIHNALKSGCSSDREVAFFEDKLLRKGSLIADLCQLHSDGLIGIGSGHDSAQLMSKIEHMSVAEQVRLRTDSTYKRDIELALETFLSKDEMKTADAWLTHTVDPTNDSQHPELFSVVHSVGEISKNTCEDKREEAIVDEVLKMPAPDCKRYHDDLAFRKQLDDQINSSILDGPGKTLLHRALAKVAAGASQIQLDQTDRLLLVGVKEIDAEQSAHIIIDALKADPTLRSRLGNPVSPEDQELLKDFKFVTEQMISRANPDTDGVVLNVICKRYENELLSTGTMPLNDMLALCSDRRAMLHEMVSISPTDRQRLLAPANQADKDWQKSIFLGFSTQEQALISNGLKTGSFDRADQVRAFTLGDGMNSSELKDCLKNLQNHPELVAKLKADYALKYGGDLEEQVLTKVDSSERVVFKKLLEGSRSDGRQDYYDDLSNYGKATTGIADAIISQGLWDGTRSGLQKELQENTAARGEFARQFKDLPRDKQFELEDKYALALEQYRNSKGQLTDKAVDAALLAATLATGGVAGAAAFNVQFVIAAAVMGATFKTTATSAMQGEDFDGSFKNVAKLSLDGAFTSGLACIPPAKLAAVFKIGDAAALQAVGSLGKNLAADGIADSGKALLKDGFEAEGKKLLTQVSREAFMSGKNVSQESLQKVADSLVNPALQGAERNLAVNRITDALAQQYGASLETGSRTLVQSIVKGGQHLGKEALINAGVGATANSAGQILTFPLDYDSRQSFSENMAGLMSRVGDSAVTGAATGFLFTAVFHVGKATINGAKSGFHSLANASQGEDELVLRMLRKDGKTSIIADRRNPDVLLRGADGKFMLVPSGAQYQMREGDQPVAIRDSIKPARGGGKPEVTTIVPSGSAMMNEATMASVSGAANEVLDRWTPLRSSKCLPETPESREVISRYQRVNSAARQILGGEMGIPEDEWSNEALVRAKLAEFPQRKDFYDGYLDAHKQFEVLVLNGVEERNARLLDMENEINKQLPPGVAKVKISAEDMSRQIPAFYTSGNGEVTIDADAVSDPEWTRNKLPSLIAHELTHLEQDSLAIRKYADNIHINGLGTDAQRAQIKVAYRQTFGFAPSDQFVERALQARHDIGDRPLTANELAREALLEQSSREDPQMFNVQRRITKSNEQFNSIRNQSSFELIKSISRGRSDLGPVLDQLLPLPILNEMIRQEIEIDAGRLSMSAWDDEKYSKLLNEAMAARDKVFAEEVAEASKKYDSLYHEQEAWQVFDAYRLPERSPNPLRP